MYKYVFQKLVDGACCAVERRLLTLPGLADTIFRATQEIALNEKAIASAEATVKSCEAELLTLRELASESPSKKAAYARAKYLVAKMQAAQTKLETLEGKNVALAKLLSQEH